MKKTVGRILLLAVALGIAAVLGYFFLAKDLDTLQLVLLGTLFMVLGEVTYNIDKKLFRDGK